MGRLHSAVAAPCNPDVSIYSGGDLRRRTAKVFKGFNHNFQQTVHKNQGPIEMLHCWILGTPEYSRYMDPDGTWPDLQSLVLIEEQQQQGDQVTSQTYYHIANVPVTARSLLQAVCNHWKIGMFLHWILDIAFPKGVSRIRTGHAVHSQSCGGWSSTNCVGRSPPRVASAP